MILEKIILWIRRRNNLRAMKSVGENVYIHPKTRIKNPEYISFGDGCYLGEYGIVEAWDKYNNCKYGPEIAIGNSVKINAFCHIGAINRIEIGNDCLFGSRVTILDHSHGNTTIEEMKIHPVDRDLYSKGPVTIGDRVWIGENAVILSGVNIGDGSVIGANAVVTHDVPAYSVAVGAPARVIKTNFSRSPANVDYSNLTKEMIAEHIDDLYTELKDPSQLDWMPKK